MLRRVSRVSAGHERKPKKREPKKREPKKREPKEREPKEREPKERGTEVHRCGAKRPVTACAGTRLLFPGLYSLSTKVQTGRLRPTAQEFIPTSCPGPYLAPVHTLLFHVLPA